MSDTTTYTAEPRPDWRAALEAMRDEAVRRRDEFPFLTVAQMAACAADHDLIPRTGYAARAKALNDAIETVASCLPADAASGSEDTARWSGTPNNWIAPMHFCPSCRGSLSWEETVDVFDRPIIVGRCRPCRFSAAIPLTAVPPAPAVQKETENG